MAAPSGTVTMLFTDIEGSTRLLQRLGESYPRYLDEHREIVRAAIGKHGGHEQATEGDSFFVLFEGATEGVTAALEAQLALESYPWPADNPLRVRMGVHTGDVLTAGGDYVGIAIHEAARIGAAGHGGQVLVSNITRELAGPAKEGFTYKDLGEHWLKDLASPQRVFQIEHPSLQREFAPIRSHGSTPHNLPVQATVLVGREKEASDVAALLDTNRVVTITGAGGAGKSRLAVRVGAEVMEEHPDGVWFAELASHTDGSGVASAVASAVGLPPGSSIDDVVASLRTRRVLLILDNCEHLIEIAAEVAHKFLTSCTELKILATSREPLGLPGEVAWRVPSLSLPVGEVPDVAELSSYEAITLFCSRASAADQRFALTEQNSADVVAICRQLDGIPLALELAAARLGALSVEQVAGRLDRRFRLLTGGSRVGLARQRTLQATVDWSYDLLSENERLLLRRVGVFSGGFSLDAAVAVASDEALDELDVVDLLSQLVGKSLATVEGERYRLLETIRQYALDKLLDAGEIETARDRHLAWARSFAEDAWDAMIAGEPDERCIHPLNLEVDNLRAAMDWGLERDPIEAEALVGACYVLWINYERNQEGHRRTVETLASAPPGARCERVRLIASRFNLGQLRDEQDVFDVWHDEANAILAELPESETCLYRPLIDIAALSRQSDDEEPRRRDVEALLTSLPPDASPLLRFIGTQVLATKQTLLGDGPAARASCEEALAIAKLCGWRLGVSRMLAVMLSVIYSTEKRLPEPALCDEAMRAANEADDPRTFMWALQIRGLALIDSDQQEQAMHFFEEALAVARRHRLGEAEAQVAHNLGFVRQLLGDLEGARVRTLEALAKQKELDLPIGLALSNLASIATDAGDFDEAVRYAMEAMSVPTEQTNPHAVPATAITLALIAVKRGNGGLAARLLGWGEKNWPAWVPKASVEREREQKERERSEIREAAGSAFDAEYAAGEGASLAEIVALVDQDLAAPSRPALDT